MSYQYRPRLGASFAVETAGSLHQELLPFPGEKNHAFKQSVPWSHQIDLCSCANFFSQKTHRGEAGGKRGRLDGVGAGGVPASEQMRAAGNQTEMRPELGGRSSSAAAAELGV